MCSTFSSIGFSETPNGPKIYDFLILTLIRSKLEYSSSVWDPHLRKDIHHLEMVQRRAARFIKRDYSYESSVTHNTCLSHRHPWKTEEK